MTTNVPARNLAAEVNAFMSTGAAPAAGASPFASPNPPEAQAASAFSASPFGAAPAPVAQPAPTQASPFGAPVSAPPVAAAPAASPFGAPAQAAPVAQAASPFGAPTIAQPAPAASPFGAFAAPQPTPAPAVDPRINECHPDIAPEKRVAWLAHCDAQRIDHRTGQPLANMQPAAIPQAAAQPASDPMAALASLAQRIYDEGRAPDATTHPEVARMYGAIVATHGPKVIPPAPAAAPKKTRRTRKQLDAATGVETEVDDDAGVPVILITSTAIDEICAFMQSLKKGAIDPDALQALLQSFKKA